MDFNYFYSNFDYYFSKRHSEGMEECIKKYSVKPCEALDIGAGEGRNSIFLSRLGFKVTAIEPSFVGAKKINDLSRKNGDSIKVINSDFLSASSKLSDLGFVVALTSLEHMKYRYLCKTINRIKKAMRKGGYIYIIAFTEEDPGFFHDTNNASECSLFIKHYFKKDELRNLFSDFEILEYAEYKKIDTTHGPEHYHGKAKLFARKPFVSSKNL